MNIIGKRRPKLKVEVEAGDRMLPLNSWGVNNKVFEWGFVGAGPLNLARAILAQFISGKTAFLYGHRFAKAVVSQFEEDGFTISQTRVRQWVTRHTNRDRLAQRRARYKARKRERRVHA